jgi:hypothetical protein
MRNDYQFIDPIAAGPWRICGQISKIRYPRPGEIEKLASFCKKGSTASYNCYINTLSSKVQSVD